MEDTKHAPKAAAYNAITDGVIWKQLLLFAAPLLVGNLFQQLYNTADSIIVGNYVGKNALAAVGSSSVIINMIIGFFMGLATGAGVLVSQYFGANDEKSVHDTVHTGMMAMVFSGLFLTVLGILLTPAIIRLIGTPEEVQSSSILYLRVFFIGITFLMVYNMGAGILRAVGDARRPLYYLIAASLTNIVLDFVFVLFLDLAVLGVALGTILSELLSAVLTVRALMRETDVYRLVLKDLRVQKRYLLQIVRVGLPAGIQQSVIAFSNVIVQSHINSFGSAAMAGCGAYTKVDAFVTLPFMSISLASTTFVGQNIGAQKWDRVKKSARTSFFISTLITIVISALIYVFGSQILSVFTSDEEVIRFGTMQLQWMAPFYVLCGFSNVCSGVIRGSGETTIPMLIMVFNFCVLRVIWLSVMPMFIHDITIVFLSYIVTWTTCAVMMMIYYKKGKWLTRYSAGS